MAQRGTASFKATKNSRFADNTTGLITAGNSRDTYEDVADSYKNIVDDAYKLYTATASGTDTYTATMSPAITAYGSTDVYLIKFTNANTGAATLNLNSLGAKSIVKNGSTALASGDLAAGQIVALAYDGTNLQIVGRIGSGITGSLTSPRIPVASGVSTVVDYNTLTFDGTKLAVGAVAPDTLLHVWASSAGAVAANGNSVATFEKNGVNYISILVPNADEAGVVFGRPSNNTYGFIIHGGTGSTISDAMLFGVAGSTKVYIQSNGNVGIGTPITGANADRKLHVEQDDASNTTVTYLQRITHTSSATPTAGFGVGIEFETETASAGVNKVGATVEAEISTATIGTEYYDLVIKTMQSGSISERARFGGVLNGNSITGQLNLNNEFAIKNATPAQITSNQNDYSDGGKGFLRISSNAARDITGIAHTSLASDGKILIIRNVGAFSITFKHENAGSSAANRITCSTAADIVLAANGALILMYDSVSTRWFDIALR